MILESVENHTCKKMNLNLALQSSVPSQITCLKYENYLKCSVHRIILQKTLKLGNLKGKDKSHGTT